MTKFVVPSVPQLPPGIDTSTAGSAQVRAGRSASGVLEMIHINYYLEVS